MVTHSDTMVNPEVCYFEEGEAVVTHSDTMVNPEVCYFEEGDGW